MLDQNDGCLNQKRGIGLYLLRTTYANKVHV
nr:MAG TPA: hypothetical protein [Caudoviricetes sp.]